MEPIADSVVRRVVPQRRQQQRELHSPPERFLIAGTNILQHAKNCKYVPMYQTCAGLGSCWPTAVVLQSE
jgi:hypothetical protein